MRVDVMGYGDFVPFKFATYGARGEWISTLSSWFRLSYRISLPQRVAHREEIAETVSRSRCVHFLLLAHITISYMASILRGVVLITTVFSISP
jgi:hypothetical protein